MEQDILNTMITLRAELHALAERSGQERRTKAYLMDFLGKHTTLRLEDRGEWFFAVHGACSPSVIRRLSAMGVDGFVLGTSVLFGKGRPYRDILWEIRESSVKGI